MSKISDDRDLAFAISDAARMLRIAFNDKARHLGLTQAQYRTLIFLNRQQGITQREMAKILEIRPITLTRLLDQLAANQLIERRANPNDRRSFQLYLTQKAEPVLDELTAIGVTLMQGATKGLGAQDKKQLAAMLVQFKNSLTPENPS